jgi:hypothetical protein
LFIILCRLKIKHMMKVQIHAFILELGMAMNT